MPVRVRVTLNRSAFVRTVGSVTDRKTRGTAESVRRHAIANINSLGRVHTGRMKDIRVRKVGTRVPESAAYETYTTAPWVRFQEFGTRAHGPRRARYMVFRIRGRGPLIFAKWVRGVTPGRFMSNALESARREAR